MRINRQIFKQIFKTFVTCATALVAKLGTIVNEWPSGCAYWQWHEVQTAFHKLRMIHNARLHGCALGLRSHVHEGKYIMKPWTLLSDSPETKQVFFGAVCPGISPEHEHTPCAGKDTKLSERYTKEFARRIHFAHCNHVVKHNVLTQSTHVDRSVGNNVPCNTTDDCTAAAAACTCFDSAIVNHHRTHTHATHTHILMASTSLRPPQLSMLLPPRGGNAHA